MNSRDTVLAAIERTGPERVPLYYCNRDFELTDVATAGHLEVCVPQGAAPGTSEWGYVWSTLDGTMGQPHGNPLADWSRIDSYIPPDPHTPGRFTHMPGFIEDNRDRYRVYCVGLSGFNQATFLRGFSTFLEDLYLEPERAERVLDIVFDFENEMIRQALEYPIDCVKFGDDWGTQNGLMISPEDWRRIFKPRYKQQFDLIHAAGKKVWFHSCGKVSDMIGDMIDIGLDVIELLQPDVLGIDWLGREFGGKICFCCSADHQRTAVSGTREEIFDYVQRLNDKLGSFNGGLIGYVEDYASLGMPEENYQAIKEAFTSLQGF